MQTINTFWFRLLVILSAVLALGSTWLASVLVPAPAIQHSALLFPESTLVFTVLGSINLLLGIATTVGLCMFWRWLGAAVLSLAYFSPIANRFAPAVIGDKP